MSEPLLHEDFRAAVLDARLTWFNPPKRWRLDSRGPGLVVNPDDQTDFWQRTLPARRRDLRNLTLWTQDK